MHIQFQVVKTLPGPSHSGAEYVEQCGLGGQHSVDRIAGVILCLDGSDCNLDGAVLGDLK